MHLDFFFFFACMHMCATVHVLAVKGGQTEVEDFLKLELLTTVGRHVGAGSQTRALQRAAWLSATEPSPQPHTEQSPQLTNRFMKV